MGQGVAGGTGRFVRRGGAAAANVPVDEVLRREPLGPEDGPRPVRLQGCELEPHRVVGWEEGRRVSGGAGDGEVLEREGSAAAAADVPSSWMNADTTQLHRLQCPSNIRTPQGSAGAAAAMARSPSSWGYR